MSVEIGDEAKCTTCGYVFELASRLGGPADDRPTTGTLSVCISCGGIDVFEVEGDVVRLVPASETLRLTAMTDPKVLAVVTAIHQRGRL